MHRTRAARGRYLVVRELWLVAKLAAAKWAAHTHTHTRTHTHTHTHIHKHTRERRVSKCPDCRQQCLACGVHAAPRGGQHRVKARHSAQRIGTDAHLPAGSFCSSSPSARRATERRNVLSCGLSCMLGAELRARARGARPACPPRCAAGRPRASGLEMYAAAGAAALRAATQPTMIVDTRIVSGGLRCFCLSVPSRTN